LSRAARVPVRVRFDPLISGFLGSIHYGIGSEKSCSKLKIFGWVQIEPVFDRSSYTRVFM